MNLLEPPIAIFYSEKELQGFNRIQARIKAAEIGDRCCHCGKDCDRSGFQPHTWKACRIDGHPFCGRAKCYDARFDEFSGKRNSCLCGKRGIVNI